MSKCAGKKVVLMLWTFLFCLPEYVFAQNLGVMGQVWPIQEVSLKTLIAEQAQQVNWNQVGGSLKQQATHLSEQLPSTVLPKSLANQTRYLDPSIVLQNDLRVRDDLVYKKGTRINPLTAMRPKSDLFFFDGSDSDQRDFAFASLKKHPTLMLVMTQGDPMHWAHQWGHPVYFAYPKLLHRFAIQSVPSLLGVGEGVHEDEVAITEFRTPYHCEWIQRCWRGCDFSLNKQEKQGKRHEK